MHEVLDLKGGASDRSPPGKEALMGNMRLEKAEALKAVLACWMDKITRGYGPCEE